MAFAAGRSAVGVNKLAETANAKLADIVLNLPFEPLDFLTKLLDFLILFCHGLAFTILFDFFIEADI